MRGGISPRHLCSTRSRLMITSWSVRGLPVVCEVSLERRKIYIAILRRRWGNVWFPGPLVEHASWLLRTGHVAQRI